MKKQINYKRMELNVCVYLAKGSGLSLLTTFSFASGKKVNST